MPNSDVYASGAGRKILPRASYTPSNALRFRPGFDKAIETRLDVCFNFDQEYGRKKLKPVTLKQRVADALLWLVDQSPDELVTDLDKYARKDYAQLRGEIRISLEETGVWVRYKNSDLRSPVSFTVENPLATGMSSENMAMWKARVTDFLGSELKLFYLDKLALTEIDITWFRTMLEGTGIEFEITPKTIKMVK